MPINTTAFGISHMFEREEEDTKNFLTYLYSKGTEMKGYLCNNHYTHLDLGNPEVYTAVKVDDDKNQIEPLDYSIHLGGPNCLKLEVVDPLVMRMCKDDMTRLIGVKDATTGEGLLFMHLINADILPSVLKGDILNVQWCAICETYEYFKTEEEYADSYPTITDSKVSFLNDSKLMPEIGTILPYVLYKQIDEDMPNDEKRRIYQSMVLTGKVLRIGSDQIKLDEETPFGGYCTAVIETKYGPIDIVHNIYDEEKNFEKMKVGSIFQGVVILQADPAIDEYENGMVIDKKNNLEALKYTMVKGKAERLESILSDDVIYKSVNWDDEKIGKKAVIDHLNYVSDATKIEYSAVIDTLKGEFEGEKIIGLVENEKNLNDIVRVKFDENDLICEITIDKSNKYEYERITFSDDEDTNDMENDK